MHRYLAIGSMSVGLLLIGCAQSAHQTGQDRLDQVIPSQVLRQVDKSVSFSDLRAAPSDYLGRTVMLSGLALTSRRVKDRTEIEILQLPTEPGLLPADRKAQSQGRFVAVQSHAFLDPAVIEKDAPLTVVGEVQGSTTKQIDDGEYRYPVLEIKHLVNWNDVRGRSSREYYDGYGYYGSPWYYGYGPYWGPYGLYPYYYGPFFVPAPVSPPPAPPPPAAIPPQFQKR